MNNILVVQFSNPSQTILENLFPSFHWNFLPDQAEEVIGQVFVYKYRLIRDSVAR